MARAGSHQTGLLEELVGQLAFWGAQVDRMQHTPGYDIHLDPLEVSAKDGHLNCRREIEALRGQLVKVKEDKERLFEANALLKGEIREIRPTRRTLPRAKQPTERKARILHLRQMISAYTGLALPVRNPYSITLNAPAAEKLIDLARLAERAAGQSLALRPIPDRLSELVAG